MNFQLQEEVRRIESLKERKASDVVKDAQKTLKILWDKCFYSEEQRDAYQHLCQCMYSDLFGLVFLRICFFHVCRMQESYAVNCFISIY